MCMKGPSRIRQYITIENCRTLEIQLHTQSIHNSLQNAEIFANAGKPQFCSGLHSCFIHFNKIGRFTLFYLKLDKACRLRKALRGWILAILLLGPPSLMLLEAARTESVVVLGAGVTVWSGLALLRFASPTNLTYKNTVLSWCEGI